MSAEVKNELNFEVIKESFIGTLKKYVVFNGRARRQEFWIFFAASFAFGLVLGWIPVVGWLVSLAFVIPSLAVGVRRLHDTERTGLMLLLLLIPLVGFIILIVFWVQEGTAGENKYGPNPKTENTGAISAASASAPIPAATGNTVCPSCGKENPAGTKFCADCGGKMEADKRICACGAEVAPGIKFCGVCGAKV